MVFPIGAMVAGDPFQSLQRTQEAGLDQAGQAALGRGIQQMFQPQIPGAIPTQPQGLMGRIGQMFTGGPPQQQAQAGGAPRGSPVQQPSVPMAQSMPPTPQQPIPQQPMQPQGGGMNPAQMVGNMSFQQILQSIVQANPGASPGVIAHALKYAQPYMNAVALDQYRQTMARIGQERVDVTARGQDIRADTAAAGQDVIKRGQDIRADTAAKKEQATQARFDAREARINAQNTVRNDQAWQRLEQQRQNIERMAQQSGVKIDMAQWRAIVDMQHKMTMEAIQAQAAGMKPEDLKKAQNEERKSKDEAILRMRSMQTGTPQQGFGTRYEGDRSNPGIRDVNTATPVKTERVTAPPPAQIQSGPTPPPAGQGQGEKGGRVQAPIPASAVQQLQEGHITTFGNGQKWTLQNGQPVQVQ